MQENTKYNQGTLTKQRKQKDTLFEKGSNQKSSFDLLLGEETLHKISQGS